MSYIHMIKKKPSTTSLMNAMVLHYPYDNGFIFIEKCICILMLLYENMFLVYILSLVN